MMLFCNENTSIYSWDGNRIDLAQEYRNNLRGPFSSELQKVLDRMRTTPLRGRYALRVVEPFKEFALVRLSGDRMIPPRDVEGVRYKSILDAEWDIFQRRWQEITGIAIIGS